MKKIALIGEYSVENDNQRATEDSLAKAKVDLNANISWEWISTEILNEDVLKCFSGIWLTTGVYANSERAIDAASFARRNMIPIIGTCNGFQHLMLDIARNLLGIEGAQHEEFSPNSSEIVIAKLQCSLRGRQMEVSINKHSLAGKLYNTNKHRENYYCSYGVSPQYVDQFCNSPLIRISGSDSEGVIRIIEVSKHPFYLGTLFVPQSNVAKEWLHPLITGFVLQVLES